MYAWIVPDIISSAVDRPFLYCLPKELEQEVDLGTVVNVPFGRGDKLKKGYVIDLDKEIDPTDRRLNGKDINKMKLKTVSSVSKQVGDLSKKHIELATWIKKRYGSTMAAAIRTVFVANQKVNVRKKKAVVLQVSEEELTAYIEYNKKKNNKARLRLSEALLYHSKIDYSLVRLELKVPSKVIHKLKEDGIITVVEETGKKNTNFDFIKGVDLNNAQNDVVEGILNYSKNKIREGVTPVSLIHGVTGSGKTSVYMELIAKTISMGKKAILLIPEISLTLQNVLRFHNRFEDRVSFIHSKLSKGEKWERFDRAAKGDLDIMIGPRSAVFTPFDNIGIIIIDEEHESSYSSDRMPKYNAIETAIKIADMNKAAVVLGSATPSIESYYKAKKKEYALFELKERYGVATLPKVHVVDMKKELLNGNRSMFSKQLLAHIKDRLDKKEQIMLFLNRRGYFGFNACRSCGTVISCPHCDVSLSLHKDGKLRCHYCGYERLSYKECPQCGSQYIGSMNAGTQQVEESLLAIFPTAKVLRMDADTTSKKNDMDTILERFAAQEADVLIGTQMIVKGHDFEKVTLMGILMADLSLNISSYTASERCFQLLMQAAGRAGRSEIKGDVILQTYRPEHFGIRKAAAQDYLGFYEEEIKYRKLLAYPPFSYMLHLNMQYKEEEYLSRAADFMRKYLDIAAKKNHVEVIGPGIPAIQKINDLYRRSIYLKHRKMESLLLLRDKIEEYISINRGYDLIDIQFDYKIY